MEEPICSCPNHYHLLKPHHNSFSTAASKLCLRTAIVERFWQYWLIDRLIDWLIDSGPCLAKLVSTGALHKLLSLFTIITSETIFYKFKGNIFLSYFSCGRKLFGWRNKWDDLLLFTALYLFPFPQQFFQVLLVFCKTILKGTKGIMRFRPANPVQLKECMYILYRCISRELTVIYILPDAIHEFWHLLLWNHSQQTH